MATDVRLKNGSVVKQFFAAPLDQLIKRRKQHERVHWYEVIDEHKPARIFLDIETCAASHERVSEGVRLVVQLLTKALGTNAPWHMADASDDRKRSFHVVGGPLMENLYHVGAAVLRLRWFAEINCADMCASLKLRPRAAVALSEVCSARATGGTWSDTEAARGLTSWW